MSLRGSCCIFLCLSNALAAAKIHHGIPRVTVAIMKNVVYSRYLMRDIKAVIVCTCTAEKGDCDWYLLMIRQVVYFAEITCQDFYTF